MGCLHENGSRKLFEGSLGTIICVVIVLLQISIQIVSLNAYDWIKSASHMEGLWYSCSTGNLTCCEKIKDAPGKY